MNNEKSKYNLIYLIIFVLGMLSVYFVILKLSDRVSVFNEKKMNKTIDSLNKQNEKLRTLITGFESSIKTYENKIDSLEDLKQEIKIVYVKKKNKIDSSSTSDIINEYKDIFSKGSVKW